VIVEVGGTVGDIECLPFLEAIRQMHRELGREQTLFIHVTLLPFVGPTKELKTKPTQHSVKELRSIGIQPDVIVARSDYPVPDDLKDKIALFCDVDRRAVIPLETSDTIYAVPLVLEVQRDRQREGATRSAIRWAMFTRSASSRLHIKATAKRRSGSMHRRAVTRCWRPACQTSSVPM